MTCISAYLSIKKIMKEWDCHQPLPFRRITKIFIYITFIKKNSRGITSFNIFLHVFSK